MQTIRMNLPIHLRSVGTVRGNDGSRQVLTLGDRDAATDDACVIIDPEEIGRRSNGLEVAITNERHPFGRQVSQPNVIGDGIGGVTAAIEWIEEPAVVITVEVAEVVVVCRAR